MVVVVVVVIIARRPETTSICSRPMMVASILNIAVRMVRAGGSVVRPMLMELERFASSRVSSLFEPSDCWKQTIDMESINI